MVLEGWGGRLPKCSLPEVCTHLSVLTKQLGAHITLFSRRSDPLAEAREEVRLACASKDQDVNTVTVDMGDAQEVWVFIQSPN